MFQYNSRGFLIFLLPILAGFGPVFSLMTVAGINIFAFRLVIILGYLAILFGVSPHSSLDKSALPFLQFFLLWTLWSALAVFWTYDVEVLASGIVTLLFGLLTSLFIMMLVKRSEDAAMIRLGWLAGAVIFCGIGLIEQFSDWHLPSLWYDNQPDYVQPFIIMSTFGNPNNFGAFLTLSITLLFGVRKKLTLGTWSLFGLFFFLLFLSGNRIGMIGVVIVSFLRFSRSQFPMLTLAPLLVILILNLPELAKIIDHPELNALISLTERVAVFCSSVEIRWRMALVMMGGLFDTDMLGVGAGNFSEIVPRLHLDSLTCGITDPHNWFFELAGEYGIVLIACYVWSLVKVCIRARQPESLLQRSGFSVVILMTGFIFASASNSTFSGPPMNWVFYGFLLSLSQLRHSCRDTVANMQAGREFRI